MDRDVADLFFDLTHHFATFFLFLSLVLNRLAHVHYSSWIEPSLSYIFWYKYIVPYSVRILSVVCMVVVPTPTFFFFWGSEGWKSLATPSLTDGRREKETVLALVPFLRRRGGEDHPSRGNWIKKRRVRGRFRDSIDLPAACLPTSSCLISRLLFLRLPRSWNWNTLLLVGNIWLSKK